jgi:hypothetical protein
MKMTERCSACVGNGIKLCGTLRARVIFGRNRKMRMDGTVFALTVCASAAVCHFVPAQAAAPMVKTQAPGFYRIRL